MGVCTVVIFNCMLLSEQHARQKSLTVEFQQEYASAIIQLDDMNKVDSLSMWGLFITLLL